MGGSPKMHEIQERIKRTQIDWKRAPFPEQPEACDLCRAMLAAEEDKRPKAAEALTHPFLLVSPAVVGRAARWPSFGSRCRSPSPQSLQSSSEMTSMTTACTAVVQASVC